MSHTTRSRIAGAALALATATTGLLALPGQAAQASGERELDTALHSTRAYPRAAGHAEYESGGGHRELSVHLRGVRALAGKTVRVSVHGDFVGRMRVSQYGRAHLERHSGVPRCFAGTRVKVTRSGTVVAYGRFHRERHHDDDMGYGMGYRMR
ncbi:hypothetical protein [Nocardioides mesophilus]|uniref:Uncharacterized protein n=1 Tax=Nocardioides mesophilus TaxID=433659 RepID=A0A7G9RG92_9ACTN|nr:hypothetical protein [Nocardioides mesophilus]QNN54617.1 hypothetical protein H9L09_10105 [Nocardioides mesophilus]